MSSDKMDELTKKWVEEIQNCKSSLEVPLLGKIVTPLCKICKNAEFYYGTWKKSECKVNAECFHDCLRNNLYECPKFDWDENSIFNDAFDENHKPID